MSIKRLIRKDEIPDDLQISKEVYLEVGTDKAIKECLKSNSFALCQRNNITMTIYFIDQSVVAKSIFLHELRHVDQYEHGGWPKGTCSAHTISDGNDIYRVWGDRIEMEATEYAIKHTSVAEVRKDVMDGYKYLGANERMFEFNMALKQLKDMGMK